MREIPILFSTLMVRAILDGRKSQTRRIVKFNSIFSEKDISEFTPEFIIKRFNPKYQPGDCLWVRETWYLSDFNEELLFGTKWLFKADVPDANHHLFKWRPSIFMPHAACRIKLEVMDVSVERLQDISHLDAFEEGIGKEGEGWKSYEIIHSGRHKGEPSPHSYILNQNPITSYMELWESINGLGSWDKNPWVYVIKFRRRIK